MLQRKPLYFTILLLICGSTYFLTAHKENLPHTNNEPLSSLSNINNPTKRDYQKIQNYLSHGTRENLKKLGDFEPRMRRFCLIESKLSPERGILYINTPKDNKDHCIVLYTSFNQNYPAAMRSLIEDISHSDFEGHILYHIGGWPNCEEGDLDLVFTPYAFKIAAIREAKRLGYKNVLWLDVSISPVISWKTIFDMIETEGYLTVGNPHMVGPYFTEEAARSLHIEYLTTYDIPSVSAGILGLNLTHPSALELLNRWHMAAKDPHAFFSPRSDQNVLSVLLHQLQMNISIPYNRIAESKADINDNSVFLLERMKTHKQKKKTIPYKKLYYDIWRA